MKESIPQVPPEAAPLKQRIDAALQRLTFSPAGRHRDTLLFLSSRKTPLPARVFEDSVLEPVDKTVWMVLALQAGAAGEPAPFPTYDQIGRKANIASKTTVARAVIVLRATRWLTLCTPPDKARRGPLFLLCDEPLTLAEVRRLDAGYRQFLQDTQGHHHARVRAVVQRELDALNDEIQESTVAIPSVASSHCSIETPEAAAQSVSEGSPGKPDATPADAERPGDPDQDSVRQHPSNQILMHQNPIPVDNSARDPSNPDSRNQNLTHQYLIPVDNLARNSARKNTVSGHPEAGNANGIPWYGVCETRGAPPTTLIYPRRFSTFQCELAQHCLNTLEPAQRQIVLDELEGRIRSEKRGMSPIYDDLRFLSALCKA